MAETTPSKLIHSPRKQINQCSPSPSTTPNTPINLRRSARRGQELTLTDFGQSTGLNSKDCFDKGEVSRSLKSKRNAEAITTPNKKSRKELDTVEVSFSPVSPELSETKKMRKQRVYEEKTAALTRSKAKNVDGNVGTGSLKLKRKKVFYKKVMFDEVEFEVGDDVYVKKREDMSSDGEEPEVEECRICFKAGRNVMIECDDCLGGFHLKCLRPPLKAVPDGDWVCPFCEGRKSGKEIELPKPPQGKKRFRTMKEKLLSSDIWAAQIERFGVIYLFIIIYFFCDQQM